MNLDSRGTFLQTHGNQGDQLLVNSIYWACKSFFLDTHNPSFDRLRYAHCFHSFETQQKGVYLRGLFVPESDRVPGGTSPDEPFNWWADEQGRTTSRDALSMTQSAFTLWMDKRRSRDHFKAWVKRFGFSQNSHPNHETPYPGNKKTPDIMTPSLLSLFIRGGEYRYFYWLLPILDLGLFVDWYLASIDKWDEKMRLLVIVLACDHVSGNWITRNILKRFFKINDKLWAELKNWCDKNGASGLEDLMIKALWASLDTGVS